MADDPRFLSLIEDAAATAIDGWHFSFLDGRRTSEPLPWSYEHLASDLAASASRVVDVDTGGGEVLARLAPPAGSVAVEDWPANVPIATRRLRPLGVEVRGRVDGKLPLDDASTDVVLNRHGDLDLAETARVLRPGGTLLTQQVGVGNETELNQSFGVLAAPMPQAVADVADLTARARDAGLVVDLAAHAVAVDRNLDVGAVVLQL
ncbi:methyltransferase type 11 [Luteimicrobium album]|uniref:Methyltransferase type 11 n=1 Tax=Luteimicrobium album TaxID=1054550 RepID=A0ABQ6I5E1_9MICO|nr:methyltransferase domain-containing protein [Luteimicrobium album]GMA25975.1 methyltransferase type 11 [Luteimicrobium album]